MMVMGCDGFGAHGFIPPFIYSMDFDFRDSEFHQRVELTTRIIFPIIYCLLCSMTYVIQAFPIVCVHGTSYIRVRGAHSLDL